MSLRPASGRLIRTRERVKTDYKQVLEWMTGLVADVPESRAAAYKPGWKIRNACWPIWVTRTGVEVHPCGGTNGKGSTASMLASVLMEAGYRTALYTSPHLTDFRERIRIDGRMIPEDFIVDFVNGNFDFFSANSFSFFELTTALAFHWFRSQAVDIAVVETGLGGRLDATNVVTPLLSVITNIALDHVAILGGTRPQIAGEKAGIIKRGVPVLIGECDDEVEPVFRGKALEMSAPLYLADHTVDYKSYHCPLGGDYQRFNIATVLSACEILKDELRLTDRAVRDGIRRVVENTHLHGRWQVLSQRPLVVCDTGHNVNGITEIVRQLTHTPKEKLHMVFGMVNDKDVDGVLALLPADAPRIILRRLRSTGRWTATNWPAGRTVFP